MYKSFCLLWHIKFSLNLRRAQHVKWEGDFEFLCSLCERLVTVFHQIKQYNHFTACHFISQENGCVFYHKEHGNSLTKGSGKAIFHSISSTYSVHLLGLLFLFILTCGISLPLTYKTANNQQAVLRMINSTTNSMRQNISKWERVVLLETIGRAKRKTITKNAFLATTTIINN